MPYVGGMEREEVLLFPPCLDDYVEPGDAVRAIDAFVRTVPFDSLGFRHAQEPGRGRPPYCPAQMLGLLLWGYANGTPSSRKLERAAQGYVPVMWLMGKRTPDFKTIAEFRRSNAAVLPGVFGHFRQWLRSEGLIDATLVAIDGSKFRAVNGKGRNFTVKKAKDKRKRIERDIERFLEEMERNDREEEERGEGPVVTAEELREKIERLKTKKGMFDELIEEMKRKELKQVSLTDPDSRSMKTGQGTNVCYNAQIAVDSKHSLIVAETVTNEPTDQKQLSEVAIEAKNALQVDQLDVVADKGYANGEQLRISEQAGITPYVAQPKNQPNQKRGLFSKDDFIYNETDDTYRCPAGETLTYSTRASVHGKEIRYYRTNACVACPLRPQCTRGSFKRISRSVNEPALRRADARARARPDLMRRRKAIVEHPFGTIKRQINGGYFLMRGLAKVRAEFSLAALAFNIKRTLTIFGPEEMIRRLALSPAAS